MFQLKITVDGKTYTDIEKGVDAAFVSGLKKILSEKLKDYDEEMKKQGVEITVDTTTGKIKISNMSDELKEKIEKALAA